jgi:hypothetical protein
VIQNSLMEFFNYFTKNGKSWLLKQCMSSRNYITYRVKKIMSVDFHPALFFVSDFLTLEAGTDRLS